MSPSAHLSRVVARLLGPRVAVALLPGWLLLIVAAVQLGPITDVDALRATVQQQGLWGDLLVAGLSALVGPGLGWAGWRLGVAQRSLLSLRRQPLGDADWLAALGPWAVLCCVLGALPAGLWGGVAGLLAAPVLVGAGAVTLLAGGGRAVPGLTIGVFLFALVGVVLSVGWPLLVVPAGAVVACLQPAVRVWRVPRSAERRVWWRLPSRARTPVEAVARRDVLALSRGVPKLWSNVLWPAPIFGGLVWLSLERGVAEGHTGSIAGGIALCLVSLVGAWALMELVTLLGPQFDVRRFPLGPLERVVALSFTLETVLSPITTAVFLACWRLDSSEFMWLGLVAMTLSAGAQALACRFAETTTPGAILSWQLWWALAVFAVLWTPWWTAAATYGAMTIAAWTFAVFSLRAKRRRHVAAG